MVTYYLYPVVLVKELIDLILLFETVHVGECDYKPSHGETDYCPSELSHTSVVCFTKESLKHPDLILLIDVRLRQVVIIVMIFSF